MAKDTSRDTRELRNGYKYLRVEIPEAAVDALNRMYKGTKANGWKPLQERDDEIYKTCLKKMVDNFSAGNLSKDRKDGPYGHLAADAKKLANAKKININTAFDHLKSIQENAAKRSLEAALKA